jgi:hypothetical protein
VQEIFGTSRIRYGSCNSFRSSWFEIDFYHFNWNFNCNYCILLYYLFIHHTRNHICCYMCFYILHQFIQIMDVHSQYMFYLKPTRCFMSQLLYVVMVSFSCYHEGYKDDNKAKEGNRI